LLLLRVWTCCHLLAQGRLAWHYWHLPLLNLEKSTNSE
jgi:hypothetical protein